jgi:hypothetical protein
VGVGTAGGGAEAAREAGTALLGDGSVSAASLMVSDPLSLRGFFPRPGLASLGTGRAFDLGAGLALACVERGIVALLVHGDEGAE